MSVPTYDREHYSYTKPGARATHCLMQEGPDQQAPEDSAEFLRSSHHPGECQRSTFNYRHHHEEHQQKRAEEGAGGEGAGADDAADPADAEEVSAGRRGSVTSQPFKPVAQRNKSFDIRDHRAEAHSCLIHDHDDDAENYSRA